MPSDTEKQKGYVVVVIAMGASEELLRELTKTDAIGNKKLFYIGGPVIIIYLRKNNWREIPKSGLTVVAKNLLLCFSDSPIFFLLMEVQN